MTINLKDPSTQLLYSTVQVIVDVGNSKFKFGTGVIIDINRQKDKTIPILITNRHVIESASRIFIEIFQAEDNEIKTERIGIEYKPLDFKCHETLDIAILPLAPVLTLVTQQGKKPFYISIGEDAFLNNQNKEKLSAIEEIIFIGYPEGIKDNQSKLPIVRKGITATPVWNNFDSKPEFLVDAEVFGGSSGSPVFIYNNGAYFDHGNIIIGFRMIFLGIISQTIISGGNNYLGLGRVINAVSILNFVKDTIKTT